MSFPKYEVYKDSGVEWLGEVPEYWEVISLKWLSPILRGASPRPIDDPKYFDDEGEYGWVRIADVSSSNGHLFETTQRLSDLGSSLSVKLEPESLFLSIAGTVGKPCVTKIRACIHDGFVHFPQLTIDYRLLYRIFESGLCFGGLGKMGTQLNLNTETVGGIRIALPPTDELIIILNFLDRETARIDALIAEQQRLIELLKEKRQAVISHAVTKGIDRTVPMKDSGVEWLGEVPEHWQIKCLKHISPRISGRLVFKPAQYFAEEGIPFLMGNNVTEFGIKWAGAKLIPEKINNQFAHYALKAGDVITVRVGDPGVTCVVPPEAEGLNCGSLMIIRRSLSFNSFWLAHVMNSPLIRMQIDKVQYGAAQEQINITDAVNFLIPFPSIEEQENIVIFLRNKISQFNDLITEAEKVIKLFQERRSALISAAVTGKIDVRNWQLPD